MQDISSFLTGLAGAAVAADTGKIHPAFMDIRAGVHCCCQAKLFGDLHFMQVFHPTAAGADKVDMGFYVSVEPFYTLYSAKADDQTLLAEQRQISVDRCQRDIRHLFFQLSENRFSGRVGGGLTHIGQDRVPLSEMLGAFHEHRPFN